MTAETHLETIMRMHGRLPELQEQRALWEQHLSRLSPSIFICRAIFNPQDDRGLVIFLNVTQDLANEQKAVVILARSTDNKYPSAPIVIYPKNADTQSPNGSHTRPDESTLRSLGLPTQESDSLFRQTFEGSMIVLTRGELPYNTFDEPITVSFAESALILAMLLEERYGWKISPAL